MTSEPEKRWTVLALLNWTKAHFERGGLSDARLAAEVLLAHVLKCRRIHLYARFDHEPDAAQRGAFRELVQRAAQREPVAYLVGHKEFYSLPFKVTHDVLIPRGETELLVSEAAEHLRALGRPGRLWDACTGSGCVAVAVAANVPDATVLATDICPQAVRIARENVESNGVGDRVEVAVADLLESPEGVDVSRPFDAVTANPPYVAEGDPLGEEVKHEPPAALYGGAEGLEFLQRVIRDAPDRLAGGGKLILEFGYGQADAVRDLIVATGRFDEPRILRDMHGIERAAVAGSRGDDPEAGPGPG